MALLGESSVHVLRRLQGLYHHGYLERPRAQLEYYHRGGSRPIAYGLGNKGGSLLKREAGIAIRPVSWGEKNRSVGRIYLEHALLVSEVMTAIELACRRANVKLLTEHDLALQGTTPPFRWKVKLTNSKRVGVIPDRVFALEFSREGGSSERAYFFLEADRGTMPVKRRNLSQTSMYRKLLAYEATWSQSIHESRFGFHRFRVLTVTTSSKRAQSLVDTCFELESGHGLFLFADRTLLDKPDEILSAQWLSGRAGKTGRLC